MASANSRCVKPIGFRNSSTSISPGCVGVLSVGILNLVLMMVAQSPQLQFCSELWRRCAVISKSNYPTGNLAIEHIFKRLIHRFQRIGLGDKFIQFQFSGPIE